MAVLSKGGIDTFPRLKGVVGGEGGVGEGQEGIKKAVEEIVKIGGKEFLRRLQESEEDFRNPAALTRGEGGGGGRIGHNWDELKKEDFGSEVAGG
ncbi:hypothetical protein TrCOL_g2349 [Triparma columacea]|uniref:Uncharacterized protein n=1 Tax=Triparma columacea TaxID=722753 RepID=A0A9W7GEX8_9STRA|nr:hypothetical protein TrCOL_g2349 [Triparma columacea]